MAELRRGHCLCGGVRWEAEGAPNWQTYCHCESCRRNCAAPVAAFISVTLAGFRWSGEIAPAVYASSPGVERRFCPRCGSPVAYSNADLPDEIHVYAAHLEDPRAYAPEAHDFWEERLNWLGIADDLPKRES